MRIKFRMKFNTDITIKEDCISIIREYEGFIVNIYDNKNNKIDINLVCGVGISIQSLTEIMDNCTHFYKYAIMKELFDNIDELKTRVNFLQLTINELKQEISQLKEFKKSFENKSFEKEPSEKKSEEKKSKKPSQDKID